MLMGRSKLSCDISPSPLSAGECLISGPAQVFPSVPVGGEAVGGPGKTSVSVLCSRCVDVISKLAPALTAADGQSAV